ncbi:dipeptidase [Alkalicoccus luteus]|uniref:Membrane dipeptidase n=1 Tax=Alkalicoccus luteus TaxID=1237094 RepID=A0A969PVX1_9BACI|nr:membrane dipeptidase [Alkalicoccus luteus]NJP39346.1 membrane dipeptidase [Alkalicoccus luteus]
MIPVIDLHCDALLQLHTMQPPSFESSQLAASGPALKSGGTKVQLFAIFIEPETHSETKFIHALEQAELFHEVVCRYPDVKTLRRWEDVRFLQPGETGAVLTLEGVDAIGGDIGKLRTLIQLGLRSCGLTWNDANLAADGVGEPRGGGLTLFGREIVSLLNEQKLWTDVSHLSRRGFFDLMKDAAFPVATHSNADAVHPHARNLDDEQLKALFDRQGLCGVVYSPEFIGGGTERLLRHVDHMLEIGGAKCLALGSDFDGLTEYPDGLENASCQQLLTKLLEQEFGRETAENICWRNAEAYMLQST